MREYIVGFQGLWRHFFIKQNVGLCHRIKDGFKFNDYRVLLKGAESDFCVYATEKYIHIVCQDAKGSVLYLMYDGVSWKKTTVLESRSAKPYVKNFNIISMAGHINLLYVIESKERFALVHHTLIEGSSPFIVDYIKKDAVPFSIALCDETDFTVFYTNEDGISGYKKYRWSQKAYSEFSASSSKDITVKFAESLSENNMSFVFTKKTENIFSLMYAETDEETNITGEATVYLDCDKSVVPIISHYGQKKYIVWIEAGSVMTSYFDDNGRWSKPVRYAKSSAGDATLYVICCEGKYEYYYGAPREHDIILYGTHDILKNPPQKANSKKHVLSEGREDMMGISIREQAEQIKKLYEELSVQKKILSDLAARLETIISCVPIADEEDIDKVLLS